MIKVSEITKSHWVGTCWTQLSCLFGIILKHCSNNPAKLIYRLQLCLQ